MSTADQKQKGPNPSRCSCAAAVAYYFQVRSVTPVQQLPPANRLSHTGRLFISTVKPGRVEAEAEEA